MTQSRLFLTFWHIGLDNLPVGVFVHRRLTTDEAKGLIEQARQKDRFLCVSNDDLLAPYNKREVKKHKDLCEVLKQDFGIPISIDDFFDKREYEGKSSYITNCLTFVQVSNSVQIMVVNCAYSMSKRDKNSDDMGFTVAPDSIEFHLFEVKEVI